MSCSRLGRWKNSEKRPSCHGREGESIPRAARSALASLVPSRRRPAKGGHAVGGWGGRLEGSRKERGAGERPVEGASGEGMRRGRKRSGGGVGRDGWNGKMGDGVEWEERGATRGGK